MKKIIELEFNELADINLNFIDLCDEFFIKNLSPDRSTCTRNTNTFFKYLNEINFDYKKIYDGRLNYSFDYLCHPHNWIPLDELLLIWDIYCKENSNYNPRNFTKIGISAIEKSSAGPIVKNLIKFFSCKFLYDYIPKAVRNINNNSFQFLPLNKKIQQNPLKYKCLIIVKYFQNIIKNMNYKHQCYTNGIFQAIPILLGFPCADLTVKHTSYDLKRLLTYDYNYMNFSISDDEYFVFINNKKIAKKIGFNKNEDLLIESEIKGSDFTVYKIIDTIYDNNYEPVVIKDEIFNAPYILLELEYFDNIFFKRLKHRAKSFFSSDEKNTGGELLLTREKAFEAIEAKKLLIKERDSLELKVKERTSELNEAYEKLKELDRLKTNFFANVTHELRTPLTLIKAPIESIINKEKGESVNSRDDVFKIIHRNTEHLLKLINNLLDFSKIEESRMNVNLRNNNISGIVRHCISNMESAFKEKGLNISYKNFTNDVYADVDSNLLEKAVYNLLSNALKFTPSGGEVEAVLNQTESDLIITVKDTGIGIPYDKLDFIFDRFSQVDLSLTRKYEGTGIGLSLTKEIVKLHGGEITVISEAGKGSEFIIRIPTAKVTIEQGLRLHNNGESSDASEIFNHKNKGNPDNYAREDIQPGNIKNNDNVKSFNILIVEDNKDMLDLLKSILGEKYIIFSAANGIEALDVLKKQDIGLVLSDIMMPEMDGYELTEKIRSDPRFDSLPVILLTAKSETSMKIEGLEKGAIDYIVKPFNSKELLARVQSQLTFKLLRDRLLEVNKKQAKRELNVTDNTKEKILIIKDFITENFSENLTGETLAAAVDMSPGHIGRMFKKHTGEKINDYINRQRIDEAARLLTETDNKIIFIAYSVGFYSLTTFNRSFLKMRGKTPGDYRKAGIKN